MLRCLLLSLVFLSSPAFAIYKCNANGKITYTDLPCTSGTSIDLGSDGRASPADAAAAHQRAEQEKRELTRLEKTRHQQEALAEKEQRVAAHAAMAKKQRCTGLERRAKWSAEDVATATSKHSEKVKRKARRASDVYQAECVV